MTSNFIRWSLRYRIPPVNSGVAGQLRSYWVASGHLVEGDVNGDAKADFSIFVSDIDHSITFDVGDFQA